jgi:hypothetical protein
MAVLVSLRDMLKVLRENPSLATEDNPTIVNAAQVLLEIAEVPKTIGISYLCENPFFPSIGHKAGVLGITIFGDFYPIVTDQVTVKQNEGTNKELWYGLTYTLEIDGEEDVIEFSTLLRSGAKAKDINSASKISIVEEGEFGEEGYSKKIIYPKPASVTAVYFPIPADGQEGDFTVRDTSNLKNSTLLDLGEFSVIVEKDIVKNGDIVTLKEGKIFFGKREISISGGSIEKLELEVGGIYLIDDYSAKTKKDGSGYIVKITINGNDYWSEPQLTKLLKAANKLPIWVKCSKAVDKVSKEKQNPYKSYSFLIASQKEVDAHLAKLNEAKKEVAV